MRARRLARLPIELVAGELVLRLYRHLPTRFANGFELSTLIPEVCYDDGAVGSIDQPFAKPGPAKPA